MSENYDVANIDDKDLDEFCELQNIILQDPEIIKSFITNENSEESQAKPIRSSKKLKGEVSGIFRGRKTVRDPSISNNMPLSPTFAKETDPMYKTEIFFDHIKKEKKSSSLLKNIKPNSLKDQSREDYLVLLFFLGVYGNKVSSILGFINKSKVLVSIDFNKTDKESILKTQDFITAVLIAAANQKEDVIIKEITRNDGMGYKVTKELIISLVKNDLSIFIKNLLNVSNENTPDSLPSLSSIPGVGKEKNSPTDVEPKNSKKREFIYSGKHQNSNVNIQTNLKELLPELKKIGKLEVVDTLILSFGSDDSNNLTLLISNGLEEHALKSYKKYSWHLDQNHILLLLEKRMWNFLFNIEEEFENSLLLKDDTFIVIGEMLKKYSDGRTLTELILLLTRLPLKGWRQNQVVQLIELSKSILNEHPDTSRLIYVKNPLLTCAQISFLLKTLSNKFKFQQHDLEYYSGELEKLTGSIQKELRESDLYALYLTPLPTGLCMLDYIIKMDTKSLVETPFTKALVLEFWDNKTLYTRRLKDISSLDNFLGYSKRFKLLFNFIPNFSDNYEFQFSEIMNSTKYLLLADLFYFALVFYVIESLLYSRINFYIEYQENPNIIEELPEFHVDVVYSIHPTNFKFCIYILTNAWIFIFYRCFFLIREGFLMRFYKLGYYSSLILTTILIITLFNKESYEDTAHKMWNDIIIFLLSRGSIVYLFFCSVLAFPSIGTAMGVVFSVFGKLLPIFLLICVYLLWYAEILNQLFKNFAPFATVEGAFFTLVEILYGPIEFAGIHDLSKIEYYATNINILIYSYSSAIIALFLLIAYLSSTYESVQKDASYKNTYNQYLFLQNYSKTNWKGFYSFPVIFSWITVPVLILQLLFSNYRRKANHFLLEIKYFIIILPLQTIAYEILVIFYYLPTIFFKNVLLLKLERSLTPFQKISKGLIWILFGWALILFQGFKDIKNLFILSIQNRKSYSTKQRFLDKIASENVIFKKRYEVLKSGLTDLIKNYPEKENVPLLEILDFLMNQGNIKSKKNYVSKNQTPKERFASLVRKHVLTKKDIWIQNIQDAKKKFFIEMLNSFQNYKSFNKKTEEDSFIQMSLAFTLLENISLENISYLRSKNISVIQTVLLNFQRKEQISIISKIEDLEKKVDLMITHFNNAKKSM